MIADAGGGHVEIFIQDVATMGAVHDAVIDEQQGDDPFRGARAVRHVLACAIQFSAIAGHALRWDDARRIIGENVRDDFQGAGFNERRDRGRAAQREDGVVERADAFLGADGGLPGEFQDAMREVAGPQCLQGIGVTLGIGARAVDLRDDGARQAGAALRFRLGRAGGSSKAGCEQEETGQWGVGYPHSLCVKQAQCPDGGFLKRAMPIFSGNAIEIDIGAPEVDAVSVKKRFLEWAAWLAVAVCCGWAMNIQAADSPDYTPPPFASAFRGMVDAKGQSYTGSAFTDAKIYVLYFSASWCSPCRQFSPNLVKFINANAASNPHMAAVMLSEDDNRADMLGYMKAENMPFPSMPLTVLQNSVLKKYAGEGIPDLVVVDSDGKVLANSYENNAYVGPYKTLEDLSKILSSGAAK